MNGIKATPMSLEYYEVSRFLWPYMITIVQRGNNGFAQAQVDMYENLNKFLTSQQIPFVSCSYQYGDPGIPWEAEIGSPRQAFVWHVKEEWQLRLLQTNGYSDNVIDGFDPRLMKARTNDIYPLKVDDYGN